MLTPPARLTNVGVDGFRAPPRSVGSPPLRDTDRARGLGAVIGVHLRDNEILAFLGLRWHQDHEYPSVFGRLGRKPFAVETIDRRVNAALDRLSVRVPVELSLWYRAMLGGGIHDEVGRAFCAVAD